MTNGSHSRLLFTPRCLPSIFATARTGPACSIVTRSTLVEYFSRGGAFSAPPSGPSCKIQTSRPCRATSRPSIAIESMRVAPHPEMRTFSRPVSISKVVSLCLTCTTGPEVDAAVLLSESLSKPVVSGPATVAKPDHLIEPSGHQARGHDCNGRLFPPAVVRVNAWSFRTLPRGHGVPQLTPIDAAGGLSPSHFNSMDESDCAAAPKAQHTTRRGGSVSDASRSRSRSATAFKVNLVFIVSLTRLSGSFGGKLPHFEVIIGHHRHALHRTQSDPPRPVRAFGVVPLDDHPAVDLNFDVRAALQNTKAMGAIGRSGGQARPFGHLFESRILAETVRDVFRLVVPTPVGISIVGNRAAVIGLVFGPAWGQGYVEDVFAVPPG